MLSIYSVYCCPADWSLNLFMLMLFCFADTGQPWHQSYDWTNHNTNLRTCGGISVVHGRKYVSMLTSFVPHSATIVRNGLYGWFFILARYQSLQAD